MARKLDHFVIQMMLQSKYFFVLNTVKIKTFLTQEKNEINILNLVKKIEKLLNLKINIKTNKLKEGSVSRRCPDVKK